ncbi:ATP-binding protein [Ruminococcus sp. 5_1_39BFAA]|uniref:ATP-binding protein n=1 Tax=Ruminococcus sp. 5_1_39BFAA TaxID=457412 RepID=UPI003568BC52
MILKRLTIKNFGKIHEKTLELSPGINVLYGENESGKTTTHTFVRSMLYGITRQRGRAAKNDIYARYEPWENPANYGGTIWFESQGKNYRLTRNFYKENQTAELLCEDDGELMSVENGDLDKILGNVSEAVYDNTVSVAQLKSVTGADLAKELENYMASYQGTGDSSVDLGRAMQMLKMSRKGFSVQQEKRRREVQKEQEKLSAKMEYLSQELNELKTRQSKVAEKEENLQIKPGDDSALELIEEKLKSVQNKKLGLTIAVLIAVAVGLVGVFGRTRSTDMLSRVGLDLCMILAVGVIIYYFSARRKLVRELTRQKKLKARWLSQQEKLKWNRETLQEAYEEKRTDFTNLQNEYREYESETYLPAPEDTEIQALDLAMDTIQAISGNIHRQLGRRLRQRTSRILKEITGGRYQEVFMDKDLHLTVNTPERSIPAERLSRGTMEQVYFALRMASGDLLCGQNIFPVILDDIFGMYDEDRLTSVLHWLESQNRQVIISTCNKREMQILDKEGIPYQKLTL